ncbi:HAD family hydrolase [Micromonospora mirobrigensis]|uniref:Hydrolase of the HAD superfamily n=1 Tax=Micromonospora mirobrigensis TaxID=262898 RepID=A0A1C4WVR6_9ACTN|nr:HAD family hydrolase [Micromonospora mirobrigensis]SCF00312.1 Haloacid dehalogenase superfamily, subfamily IA, variant 2 with 3rd motif like haloacid dehalogenase/haloacid dehalogenase superfamily, subfamily IA, variant 3 with third motif having DD or ED/haloacid dehalogenase superfamily, subfamily IA, variant 1 with third motif having Dx(3-4)D or Dx(3-4)E [Micromonospora mirobrigensis]
MPAHPTPAGAVLFDAADTLFHNRGLAELFDGWERAGDPKLTRTWLDAAIRTVGGRGLWPADSATGRERRAAWTDFYRLAFLEGGHPPPAAAAYAAECAGQVVDPAAYRLFADVPEVLDALDSRGLPLGIVSNFDPLIWPILDRLDLRRRFGAIVTSYDVGCYKPDPRIFRIATDRLGVPTGDVLFVGDSPYSDVGGAAAAGMAAVLVDRTGAYPDFAGPRVTDLRALLHPGAGRG